MIPVLNICLVQYDISWLAIQDNLNYLEQLNFHPETQLIVLPEMFATGFCMQPEMVAQAADGEIVNWMKSYSEKQQKAICGSVAIRENDKYYNRFFIFYRGELLATYNKRHLFSYSGEDKKYTAGKEWVCFEFLGWKICPQICYDLRFPVWSRNTNDYDILLNVANWPESRNAIWENLLQARSIENMCYTIGCNRIGKDGNDLYYIGKSEITFPSTEKLPFEKEDTLIYYKLNADKLLEYRKKFPFLKDRDNFELKP